MGKMMRSAEFARLCGTTKDTLIHYDEMGLLRPAERTPAGYRLYSGSEYYRFVAIRTLVDSGMALADIRETLEGRDAASLVRVLEANESAIEGELARLRRSLKTVRELRAQAEAGLGEVPGSRWVSEEPERRILVAEEMEGTADDWLWPERSASARAALETLGAIAPEAELAPYGMITAAHRSASEPQVYDAAFYLLPQGGRSPIDAPLLRVLPAGSYASVVYEGPWREAGRAHVELESFVAETGMRPKGDVLEIFGFRLFDGDSPDSTVKCRVCIRVEE